MTHHLPRAFAELGTPAVRGNTPTPLRTALWAGVALVYLATGGLFLLIIALNPDTWYEMLSAEASAFAWLSCGLLLSSAVIAGLTGLVQRVTPVARRPSPLTAAAWLGCGAAFFVAALDEGFRLHERLTSFTGLDRSGPRMAHIHPLLIVYALVGIVFTVVVTWRRYKPCRWLRGLMVLGLVGYGCSVGVEAFVGLGSSPLAEEILEFLAEASFLAAFYLSFVAELSELVASASTMAMIT